MLSHVSATALRRNEKVSSRGRRAICSARKTLFLTETTFISKNSFLLHLFRPVSNYRLICMQTFTFAHNPMESSFTSTLSTRQAMKCHNRVFHRPSSFNSLVVERIRLKIHLDLVTYGSGETRITELEN